jgi:hypothetical protein
MSGASERPCKSCYVAEGPHRGDCYWYNPSYESGKTRHSLKVHVKFWDSLVDGTKRFDLRRNDRRFKLGDELQLRRYDPVSVGYTGEERLALITYILHPEDCPGLERGFVILGLGDVL